MTPGELLEEPVFPAVMAAATMSVAALFRARSRSRRLAALNRSLHEIRRPLQVLALAILESRRPAVTGFPGRLATEPVRQAISALALLDRQINGAGKGSPGTGRSELVAVRLMADACVRRWLPFARLAGSRLDLSWTGPDVLVRGDGAALAGAIENLIANAIEHGGPRIEVSGMAIGRKVRLVVSDSGTASRDVEASPGETPEVSALAGIAGHGHGLEVVRETVSAHRGKFETEFGPARSEAVVVLPVSPARRSGSVGVKVNW